MNCVCRAGTWSCVGVPQVISQALAEDGNAFAGSSNSDAVPSYAVALIVIGTLILVMLLVVVVQLVVFVRS